MFLYNYDIIISIKRKTNVADMIEKLKDFEIYIFDFDGTLINSEPFHKKAHNLVLNEIFGKEIVLTDQMFSKYIGKATFKYMTNIKLIFMLILTKIK